MAADTFYSYSFTKKIIKSIPADIKRYAEYSILCASVRNLEIEEFAILRYSFFIKMLMNITAELELRIGAFSRSSLFVRFIIANIRKAGFNFFQIFCVMIISINITSEAIALLRTRHFEASSGAISLALVIIAMLGLLSGAEWKETKYASWILRFLGLNGKYCGK